MPIKDAIFYGNKGMQGAVQFHTLKPGQKNIPFEEWMKTIRTQPMVCSSVETFGDVKAAVQKLCSICGCCTHDEKAAIDDFFLKVETVGKQKF